MGPTPFLVVLDANVLFPFTLRDTLLRAAAAGYFLLRWSKEILAPAMANDPKDRHVVAVAVKAGAQVIVTSNLRDFVPLPEGIEAQSPDEFLCHLLDLEPGRFVHLLQEQANDLQKPPVTLDELLERLQRVAPRFVEAVSRRAKL